MSGKRSTDSKQATTLKVCDSKYPVLSERREAFARYRAAGCTVMESHKQAGYAVDSKNAYMIANNMTVARRVAELMEYNSGPDMVDKGYLIHQLTETIELAKKQEWNEEHQEFVPSASFNLTAANAAIKMLGDALGAWKPTVDESVKTSAIDAKIAGRAEELDAYAKKYMKALETYEKVQNEGKNEQEDEELH